MQVNSIHIYFIVIANQSWDSFPPQFKFDGTFRNCCDFIPDHHITTIFSDRFLWIIRIRPKEFYIEYEWNCDGKSFVQCVTGPLSNKMSCPNISRSVILQAPFSTVLPIRLTYFRTIAQLQAYISQYRNLRDLVMKCLTVIVKKLGGAEWFTGQRFLENQKSTPHNR